MPHRVIYIISAALAVGVGISAWQYMTYQKTEQSLLSDNKTLPMEQKKPEMREKSSADTVRATMKTNYGDITIELFSKDAPLAVENFVKLSREGFYDGTRFHRVIKGFMIQGGDPNSKDDDWSDDGTGGPGYTFKDEINEHHVVRGALAMANAGPATNGSQFFIVTADAAPWLDGKHTVFGRVMAGMGAVDAIESVPTDKARGDHPTQDITIRSIEISTE